jgi:hypothetical protein
MPRTAALPGRRRSANTPDSSTGNLGFRVVSTLQPSQPASLSNRDGAFIEAWIQWMAKLPAASIVREQCLRRVRDVECAVVGSHRVSPRRCW